MSTIELDLTVAGDDVRFARTYTLDGVAVRLILTWMDRLRRWSLELQSPAGVVIALPQLAHPGGKVTTDVRRADTPSGTLQWAPGPDPYQRSDLGASLVLTYTSAPPDADTDVAALIRAVA